MLQYKNYLKVKRSKEEITKEIIYDDYIKIELEKEKRIKNLYGSFYWMYTLYCTFIYGGNICVTKNYFKIPKRALKHAEEIFKARNFYARLDNHHYKNFKNEVLI